MLRDETMYLQDIVQSCEKVLQFTSGLTQPELIQDQRTYDAVVRNLEIIGEAAKHISDGTRRKLPDVEWKKVAGLRDMLSHAYFGIDDDILWDVIQNRVPQVASSISTFLDENL